jgi:hypothetical protein
MRGKVYAVIACAVLLAAFFVISRSATLGKSACFDEPLHFVGAWIQTHYGDFRCNPEDPPLWKYYIAGGTRAGDLKVDRANPLWRGMLQSIPAPAVHFVAQTMYRTPGNANADKLLDAARIRMLAPAVVLGAAIGWWAWRLRGPVAAVVAVAAFSLDPNFLAHSPLIKNDVPITLIFFVLMAAIWLVGERATILRLVAIALLVSISLTTKFSGILALPLLAIALFCRVLINAPWPLLHWTLTKRWSRLAAASGIFAGSIILGFAIIWATYGFRFSPVPGSNEFFDFHSPVLECARNEMLLKQNPPPAYPSNRELQQWVNDWKPSLTVRAVRAANKIHLLPQAWLFGFLYTYATSLARRTFLCGRIGVVGWWYYFPAAMLFKTPLATLVGLALALVVWLAMARFHAVRNRAWPICAVLVCPLFYMAVAMRSHLNIGLRHIFPVYPFLFLFLGVIAARAFARRPKLTGAIVGLLFVGLVAETWSAYPNYIPFFNVAFGGSRGGLALLSDSNIDWGQDLPALAQWQRQHEDRQLYLCHFGLPDPRYYGIHYIEMDGSQLSAPDETVPSGLPPVYAISAVALQGPYMTQAQLQTYSRFAKEKPFKVLNGTIYLFDHAPAP